MAPKHPVEKPHHMDINPSHPDRLTLQPLIFRRAEVVKTADHRHKASNGNFGMCIFCTSLILLICPDCERVSITPRPLPSVTVQKPGPCTADFADACRVMFRKRD